VRLLVVTRLHPPCLLDSCSLWNHDVTGLYDDIRARQIFLITKPPEDCLLDSIACGIMKWYEFVVISLPGNKNLEEFPFDCFCFWWHDTSLCCFPYVTTRCPEDWSCEIFGLWSHDLTRHRVYFVFTTRIYTNQVASDTGVLIQMACEFIMRYDFILISALMTYFALRRQLQILPSWFLWHAKSSHRL
jgi:hypothetical protein